MSICSLWSDFESDALAIKSAVSNLEAEVVSILLNGVRGFWDSSIGTIEGEITPILSESHRVP